MTHYAYVLSVDRLQLNAHIGFYEQERLQKQVIEVSYRLYFAQPIDCNSDDNAPFFDYGVLSSVLQDFVATRKFNLIEYMAMALFHHLRAEIDQLGGEKAKLWLCLNKIHAPVPGLLGGASFMHSDLPPGATFIPGAQL